MPSNMPISYEYGVEVCHACKAMIRYSPAQMKKMTSGFFAPRDHNFCRKCMCIRWGIGMSAGIAVGLSILYIVSRKKK